MNEERKLCDRPILNSDNKGKEKVNTRVLIKFHYSDGMQSMVIIALKGEILRVLLNFTTRL